MATDQTTGKASPAAAAPAAGKKRRRASSKATTAAKKPATTRARKTKKTAAASKTTKTTTKSTAKSQKTTTTTTTTTASSTSGLPAIPPPSRMLLVDNGGDTLKYGWMDTSAATTGSSSSSSSIPSSQLQSQSHSHFQTHHPQRQPLVRPHSLPNVSARLMHQFTTLVGDELTTKVQNPNSLMARTRSTERGIICNLENQTRVWKRMLDLLGVSVPTHTVTAKCLGWNVSSASAKKKKKAASMASRSKSAVAVAVAVAAQEVVLPDPTIPSHAIGVVLLLPPHCPRVLLDQILTVWMEDLGVSHVGFGISSVCASHEQSLRTPWKTSCTVDLGWSSTLVVPTFRNQLILVPGEKDSESTNTMPATTRTRTTVRRMPIGGRHMVNMLKYYMSYRQYNLMDQGFLMRDVFERLSYLSLDMRADLKLARRKPSGRRSYDRDFVLPDYTNTRRGEIRIPLALQRDLEKEEQQKKRKSKEEQQQGEEDDDDDDDDDDEEEGDEDFEGNDHDDDDDDTEDDDDDDFREDTASGKTTTKKSTKKRGKGKETSDNDNDNDNDNDDDDDEEESMEAKRRRLLRERAEEERRKREQQEEEQVLRVSVERFVVPEVLFRPIDAGLPSDLVGLARAIVQSVEACPECYRPALYRTVYLVGGVANLPNLKERLERELRSLVPSEHELEIVTADSPIDRAWLGARARFETEPYTRYTLSRREWEESSKRKAYTRLLIENGGFYT